MKKFLLVTVTILAVLAVVAIGCTTSTTTTTTTASSGTTTTTTTVAPKLYVRGDFFNNGWKAEDGTNDMTESNGVYTLDVTIDATTHYKFKFADADWSSTANWGAPTTGNEATVDGRIFNVVCSSSSGDLEVTGDSTTALYTFCLNINDATASITKK